jgi:capsular exopolysaccharide synthesis family protein
MTRKQEDESTGDPEQVAVRERLVTVLPVRDSGPSEAETAPNDAVLVTRASDPPGEIDESAEGRSGVDRSERQRWPTADAEKAYHPAYERITQRLLSYRRTKRENAVLVVSAIPEEGASTVARNIALAIGSNQFERVVLVDANLRNPVQHEVYGVGPSNGVSDVVTGAIELEDAVKTGFDTNLSLVTCGSAHNSPPHILSDTAFHSLIAALRTEFDWVIIDGPPVTTHPDAAAISSACGGAVLVLRAEKTRWEVADEAKRVLENAGVEVLGAILNRRKYHIPWFIYRRL